MPDLTPEELQALQEAAQSARRSNLVTVYRSEMAAFVRHYNNLVALEAECVAAGAFAEGDMAGENQFLPVATFGYVRARFMALSGIIKNGLAANQPEITNFIENLLAVVGGGTTI